MQAKKRKQTNNGNNVVVSITITLFSILTVINLQDYAIKLWMWTNLKHVKIQRNRQPTVKTYEIIWN